MRVKSSQDYYENCTFNFDFNVFDKKKRLFTYGTRYSVVKYPVRTAIVTALMTEMACLAKLLSSIK